MGFLASLIFNVIFCALIHRGQRDFGLCPKITRISAQPVSDPIVTLGEEEKKNGADLAP